MPLAPDKCKYFRSYKPNALIGVLTRLLRQRRREVIIVQLFIVLEHLPSIFETEYVA
jgi:hypothetical protein